MSADAFTDKGIPGGGPFIRRRRGSRIREASQRGRAGGAENRDSTAAGLILASWGVGDHYAMLISLARRRLGEDRLRAILAPTRAKAVAILERGQQDGTFATHLPAPVLALATESVVLAALRPGR